MIPSPNIKIHVNDNYLTNNKESGYTEAYLMAVDCRPNDIIRFTVLLESGAVWSGLPIEAIYCDKFGELNGTALENEQLQPYSCLEGQVSVISYGLIKNVELSTKLGKAYYLFTINYQGEGLSEDPEQYKTHNIVVLESGQLAAFPNNYIKVVNNWFNKDIDTKNYQRTSKYYFAGG
jgi:hypothetical protein